MEHLVSIFVVLLIIIATTELLLSLKVLRELLSAPEPNIENTNWPKASVILSLRGIDPSLKACITGLFKQDYPHYHIHIIVDNDTDPAWEVITECTENLSLKNLASFTSIPDILEVSIGHALIADALEMGLANAVKAYLASLEGQV